MSLPRVGMLLLVTSLLVGVLMLSCSSDDEGDAATDAAPAAADGGAAAPADTPVAADTTAEVQVVEAYTLVQQFELSLTVTSSKFNRIRRIPRKYSCTEEDISVPITWSDPPEGPISLALVVDSNQHPGALWVHWVLWGIPPDARELPEAVPNTPEAPSIGPKARQGTNNEKLVGWSGPCPSPIDLASGSGTPKDRIVSEYFFKLYALDTEIELGPEATKGDLLRAIEGHILAGGEVMGEHVSKKQVHTR